MKRVLPVLVLASAMGCASRQQPAPAAPAAPVTASAPPATDTTPLEDWVDHAGDSLQTAISVPEDASDGGVDFENHWIFDRYGRFKRTGGGTGSSEGRRYNVVKIELTNGDRKTVYFDITENWLKWQPPEH